MRTKGFTLIELLAVTSIIAILCFAGIPSLCGMLERQKATNASTALLHSLGLARDYAIQNSTHASVCPSDDGQTCVSEWASRVIVYEDQEGDGVLAAQSDILHTFQLDGEWKVKWVAFGRKPQLTITAQGYTKHQNGSFYLCPPSQQHLGRLLIVNKAGRGRIAPDENSDGYAEKSNGDDMTC